MVEKIYMSGEVEATNPGDLTLSMEKLMKFHPSFGGGMKFIKKILNKDKKDEKKIQILREHLCYGQVEPAVVILTDPCLIVSVHSIDIDCTLLLQFPNWLIKKYSLVEGSRLLSINTYGEGEHSDVFHGAHSAHEWNSFWPIIGEFISDDASKIKNLKEEILEDLWDKTYNLGKKQIEEDYIYKRYGEPFLSCIPSKLSKNSIKAFLGRIKKIDEHKEKRNSKG